MSIRTARLRVACTANNTSSHTLVVQQELFAKDPDVVLSILSKKGTKMPEQAAWRFCAKCEAMFFDGFPSKGVCAAGGPHQAAGFNFVLPHVDDEPATFDSGSLTSSLPLGGSVHLVMRKSGDFTFSCHAHDSGFDNIDYVVSALLMTPSGIAFTFQHSGNVEGTSAGLPFKTPRRDDDFITGGNNPSIANEFGGMPGAKLEASIDGKDTLVRGLEGELGDLLKKVGEELGKAA